MKTELKAKLIELQKRREELQEGSVRLQEQLKATQEQLQLCAVEGIRTEGAIQVIDRMLTGEEPEIIEVEVEETPNIVYPGNVVKED